ncbi:MAG TPA: hypothetical protein VG165_14435 [Solirubrobacteraceae bacterium]|nr:hypothetical protein [Solirubrobacteraceae bacterium]
MSTTVDPSQEARTRLRVSHGRLRTASKDLESLLATEPIKGRWDAGAVPQEVLDAARHELGEAYARLTACHAELLGAASGPDDGGPAAAPQGSIEVLEKGRVLSFTFADLLLYHGPGSPGGVAHAFKVMECAFPLLAGGAGQLERREIMVTTAFGGPGARDGFEMVTRAVTGDRYLIDLDLARPERGRALERFVFRVDYRTRSVTLAIREGFVTDEFIGLARKERSPEEDALLDRLKLEMADRVMSSPGNDVYEATPTA